MVPTSRLESFPAELLLQICGYLNLTDIKAVRFLSRKWAGAGLHRVMEYQSFVLAPQSIERLETIAKDPVCSSLVRCIVCEMDRLDVPGVSERYRYNHNYLDRVKQRPTDLISLKWDPGLSKEENLALAWERYQEIADFQKSLDGNDVERRSLYSRMLANFLNVDCVKLTIAQPKKWVLGRCWTGPSCKRTYDTIPMNPKPSRDSCGDHRGDLEDLLLATADTQKHLSSIQALCVSWSFFEEELDKNKNIWRMQGVLKELRHLSLTISFADSYLSEEIGLPGISKDPKVALREIPLAFFLAQASNLTELELMFWPIPMRGWVEPLYPCRPRGLPIHLTRVIGQFSWPSLRRLTLSWVMTAENYLLEVLCVHRKTLKELSMAIVSLTSGDWQVVFDQIVNSLDLYRLQLDDLFQEMHLRVTRIVRATVRGDGSVKLKFPLSTCPRVRLWSTSHTVGQILTGRGLDNDDAIMRCLDWWYRDEAHGRDRMYRYEVRNVVSMPRLHLRC